MKLVKKAKYVALCERLVGEVFPQMSVGGKLPSTQELCDRYQISEITVNRALGLLAEQGVISRTPGRGTVLEKMPDRPGQINFAKGPVVLSILGIRGWRFTDALESLLKKYSEHNPHVSYEMTRVSEGEYLALQDEGPYDLTLVNTWLMRELVTTPQLCSRYQPVSELGGLWLDESGYFSNVLRWCRSADDRLMCLPMTVSPVVGLVNPTYPGASVEAFEQARTLDQFVSLMHHLRDGDGAGRGFPMLMFLSPNRWPYFLRTLGAELFSEDGKRCLIDQPKAVAGISLLVDLLHRHRVCNPSCVPLPVDKRSSVSLEDVSKLFATGKFAYMMASHAETHCSYPFEAKYVMLPAGEHVFSPLQMEGVMVGANSKKHKDIADVLNFMMHADNQFYLSQHSDGFSCQRSVAQAYAALRAQTRPGFECFIDQIECAEPVVAAPCQALWEILVEELYLAWMGLEDPAVVCRNAADKINHRVEKTLA